MGIPVNADYFLCMTVMKPDSLPESNHFVNTLFFRNDVVTQDADDVADILKTVMDAFWVDINAPGAVSIQSLLSQAINPALTEYRVYDLGQAEPRTPHVRDSSMSTTGGSIEPNEVAMCLSYFSGTNTPRKRGRIFIGPLAEHVKRAPAAGDDDARLSANAMNALAGGALDILNTTQNVTWVQYSRVANVFSLVTEGWVDDRFDIQRRRGAPPTTRQTWGP